MTEISQAFNHSQPWGRGKVTNGWEEMGRTTFPSFCNCCTKTYAYTNKPALTQCSLHTNTHLQSSSLRSLLHHHSTLDITVNAVRGHWIQMFFILVGTEESFKKSSCVLHVLINNVAHYSKKKELLGLKRREGGWLKGFSMLQSVVWTYPREIKRFALFKVATFRGRMKSLLSLRRGRHNELYKQG